MHELTRPQRIGLVLATLFYVTAGSFHFIRPETYRKLIPPDLPWPDQLVAISGLFEILGGTGLLFASLRRKAAWGLVALLIAVFPANIYMATNPAESGATSIVPLFRWARLPFQLVLIWWVLWSTHSVSTVRKR